jgi:AraC-like DNA-binding protein
MNDSSIWMHGRAAAAAQQELCAIMQRHTPSEGAHATAISGLQLYRYSKPGGPIVALYQPSLCLLAQGRKRVLFGDQVAEYGPMRHLVVSQELPASGHVLEASPQAPYFCVYLAVDVKDVASVMIDIGRPTEPAAAQCARGMYAEDTTPELLDVTLRLLRLLDTPRDISVLAPLIKREIIYRLLTSPNGWRLARCATPDSYDQRIGRAIDWLRQRFKEPLRIADIAETIHMSESSLHKHFRTVTGMTPLQYQKQLRLQEARRILMANGIDAGTAAHTVGYESPSQFSREYARMFGAPPARDRAQLRAQPRATVAGIPARGIDAGANSLNPDYASAGQ